MVERPAVTAASGAIVGQRGAARRRGNLRVGRVPKWMMISGGANVRCWSPHSLEAEELFSISCSIIAASLALSPSLSLSSSSCVINDDNRSGLSTAEPNFSEGE
jgi:hypothetical protein